MVESLLTAYLLKEQRRTGWSLRGVEHPESVADHSWGSAFLTMLYAAEAGVNRAHAVEIALVHDLAEALTGDVPTRVASLDDAGIADAKRAREERAMDELVRDMPADRARLVRARWEEYEARSTPEARFVRDMNLIDMCLQALVYERDGRYDPEAPNPDFPDYRGLDEFFATTEPRLDGALARELFADVRRRYLALPSVERRRT